MKFLVHMSIMVGIAFSAVLAHAQGKEAVAVIGSKTITLDEFNKKYNDVKNLAANPPSKALFLEDLIRYEVGLQEAEKRKLDQDPVVRDRMRQELYKAFVEREIGGLADKITISDKELEDYYRKNPEIRTSQILISLKPGATPAQRAEAKKRADEILEEVKKSKRPFEELVRLYSDDEFTKQLGGDAGFQSRATLFPAYYEAAFSMKVGEIRGLVESPYGFHIIKVTGRRSFENSNKRALRALVFDEKRKVLFDNLFNNLKKNYKIETNLKLIQ